VTYVYRYETGKWTVPRRKRVSDDGRRNDICALTRLTRVYLDKVPARNRLKSESMPTMKGVKRHCASVLAAIKAHIKPSCVRGTD